ncbi:ferritin-like domain-containing protein [Actinomadura chokoriensis]|uniref:Ferritin-like domain-containing protein n=1 Tax=Actinomadura chokoriensis TaxID=454156 RepID=A0ABV4R906_9ACTN
MPEAMPRRALLLGGGAALILPWLSGCEAKTAPHADVPLLVGAIVAEQNLIAAYEAARSAHAPLAGRLDPVLAHHREHLAVLKRHYVPGSGDRASEGGAVPSAGTASQIPAGDSAALTLLRDAEDRAARARTADAAKADPALAQLLASIGACEAGHAGTVKGRAPAVRSTSDAEALRAALAAEHAAVYGYGLLGARLTGALREVAKDMWNGHRAQRDRLESILSGEPVPAATAYRPRVRVSDARGAARLAVALEDDLVPAYVGLAGASSPDLRAFAADSAQRAMARSARWRVKAGAAIPRDAFPGLPSAALSPRPEPGE